MRLRTCICALFGLLVMPACRDPLAGLDDSSPVQGSAAAGGGTRYQLRFVYGVNPAGDGEIQSGWFPDTGITLNTRTPWKNLVVAGAPIALVNFTHGNWASGTCGTFVTTKSINVTTWDITGTDPLLSFAGNWRGALTVWQSGGTNVAFDGDRVMDDVVTPAAGGIHNVVSNGNRAIESRDPTGNNDWFQLELRDAVLKFGSASSADGSSNPGGVEVACANFTLLARRASLVTP